MFSLLSQDIQNIIVFDLEWNQNPGGKEASVERLSFEIFEIGAVKLNEEREKVAEFAKLRLRFV